MRTSLKYLILATLLGGCSTSSPRKQSEPLECTDKKTWDPQKKRCVPVATSKKTKKPPPVDAKPYQLERESGVSDDFPVHPGDQFHH